jgi:DNA repair exonuclease SbcCD ATPase subunit
MNNDKRMKEIPVQIRSHQGQIDKIQRDIEYDQQALKGLRQTADKQNSIAVLRSQTVTDLENLQESVSDHSFVFQKFNLPAPAALPGVGGGDDNGDELVEAVDTFATVVGDKYETVQQDLGKAKDDQTSKQRVVSEKSALLAHNKQRMISCRTRLDDLGAENGAVSKFERVVSTIKQFEQGAGIANALLGKDPQNVSAHLTARIEELEASSKGDLQPEVVAKIMDQLMELVRITFSFVSFRLFHDEHLIIIVSLQSMEKDDTGNVTTQACPCCRREFNKLAEFDAFKEALDDLKDVERSVLLRSNRDKVEKSRAAKVNYQRWRKAASETMHDVLESNRLTTELKDIEVVINDIEQELAARQSELDGLTATCSELQIDANELRDLVDSTKRWSEDARRLSRKKMEIGQKQVDLSISTSHITDRDLQTVEDDLSKRTAEKDELTNKINSLNKTMSELNTKIAQLSQQVRRNYSFNHASHDHSKFQFVISASSKGNAL